MCDSRVMQSSFNLVQLPFLVEHLFLQGCRDVISQLIFHLSTNLLFNGIVNMFGHWIWIGRSDETNETFIKYTSQNDLAFITQVIDNFMLENVFEKSCM